MNEWLVEWMKSEKTLIILAGMELPHMCGKILWEIFLSLKLSLFENDEE
jgi:hypothetical protein